MTTVNGMSVRINAAILALALALLINLFGLVWGAAKIDSAVNVLSRAVIDLDGNVEDLRDFGATTDARLRVIEDRMQRDGGTER